MYSDDPEGMDPFGYTYLEFYIDGGEASGQDPEIAGRKLSDWGIEAQADTWTLVSIPISELILANGRLTSVLISGMVKETFYLEDMKLVAQEPPEPMAVEEASEMKAIPSGYALGQNVPNPFNPLTTIAYELPQASDVMLTIYAITGQKVVLVDAHQQAGHHTVRFDGSGFGNGVYLYRLETGGFVETRRMLLLK